MRGTSPTIMRGTTLTIATTTITTDAPTWEQCKENVLPIKRGRSAKGLGDALQQKTVDSVSLEKQQEQAFEDAILAVTNNPSSNSINNDNPASSKGRALLEAYVGYFKWIRDTYPTNSDKALKLLERCTCELKDHEDLRNDVRFVKMWIEYADMVPTPGEIFTFMQSNKIGEQVSLFWLAWAFIAEKAENFKMADDIFKKGVRRRAEPKDMLAKRYQQFQKRLARHFLNQAEMGDDRAAAEAAMDVGFGVSSNRGGSSSSSSSSNSRSGSTSGGGGGGGGGWDENSRPLLSSSSSSGRRALGSLSQGQADGTDRVTLAGAAGGGPLGGPLRPTALASSARPLQPSHPASRTTASSSSAISAPSSSVIGAPTISTISAATANARAGGFQIFSDTSLPSDVSVEPTALTENPRWRHLAPETARRKENSGPVTVWTAAPLNSLMGSDGRAVHGLISGGPAVPAVPIFVDEVFAPNEEALEEALEEKTGAGEKKQEEKKERSNRGGLSVRRRLDSESFGPGDRPSLAGAFGSETETGGEGTLGTRAGAGVRAADRERIASDPLARHKRPANSTATVVAPATAPMRAPVPGTALTTASQAAPRPAPSDAGAGIGPTASTTVASSSTTALPFAIFSDSPSKSSYPSEAAPHSAHPSAAPPASSSASSSTSSSAPPSRRRHQEHHFHSEPSEPPQQQQQRLPVVPDTATSSQPASSSSSGPPRNPATTRSFASAPAAALAHANIPATYTAAATSSSNGFSIFVDSTPSASAAANSHSGSVTDRRGDRGTGRGPKEGSARFGHTPSSATAAGHSDSVTDRRADRRADRVTSRGLNEGSESLSSALKEGSESPRPLPLTTPSEMASDEDQDREIHDMLAAMIVGGAGAGLDEMDEQDGTINTRMAKRDIDRMFASPSLFPAQLSAIRRRPSQEQDAFTSYTMTTLPHDATVFAQLRTPLSPKTSPGYH